MTPSPRRRRLGRSAAAEIVGKKPARPAPAHQPTRPPANGCRRTALRAKLPSRNYEGVTFFFFLDDFFIIGLAALVLLPPLAKQSAIAAD